MDKTQQAKHISDAHVIGVVTSLKAQTGYAADLRDVCDRLCAFPPKVVQAKLRSLIKQGKLDGCACGCSGGFTATGL